VKTSDLVTKDGQVPDIGQLSSAAPQLFTLGQGQVSSPINTGRTGVVAKLIEKDEPSADEIAKNFDRTREGVINQRRDELFSVFTTNLVNRYQKEKRSDQRKSRRCSRICRAKAHLVSDHDKGPRFWNSSKSGPFFFRAQHG
jgi:hypothetical protein